MQITEQIIQRIARQVFNQMFPSSLRQSGAVISGSGGSVQYAAEAGHAATADSATYATSAGTATTANAVAWANVSDKPAQATRWPAWSEVTSKPTSKSAWGQTYLDASSVFQNVSGALSSVTDLTMSGKLKIGSIYIEAQTDYIEVYKLDENNNKIAASLCAYGGVSALGVGTGGGGGGGTSLQAVWTAMANATNEQINISHLAGTNGALATMTGYTTSGKNYAVQKDASNHLYVNVPWTDTVYTLPAATSAALGGIKIGYTTDGANRNYAVQLSSNQAYVNVPWTDHYDWSDITNKPAQATRWPAWSEVTSKPTSKSAWGQTYLNASSEFQDISGNMSSVGNITFSASGKSIGGLLYFDTTNSRIGLGTPSPSYKLHVAGDIYATGGVSCLSDLRKKDVLTYKWAPCLSMIADAPIIRYIMKDDEQKRERIGSVAQYWQKVMPETVNADAEGTLSMNYGEISLVSVIALAREVKRLKAEIEQLKKK